MAEYTYNDLLEALYHHREERRMQNESMKAQAWINSQCMSNIISAAFGGKMQTFEEMFPAPKKKITTEELKAEFLKHKMVLE